MLRAVTQHASIILPEDAFWETCCIVQAAADTKDGGSKVMASFSSMDEGDTKVCLLRCNHASSLRGTAAYALTVAQAYAYALMLVLMQGFGQNPADPTKFFQQQDNGNKDVIQLALLVAFLYLIYNVFAQIEHIK